jgi:predicted ATPase with chaperone activity
MIQRVATVAFEGIEARAADVQVRVTPGLPAFNIVGLPDKAVFRSQGARACGAGKVGRVHLAEALSYRAWPMRSGGRRSS